MNKFVPGDLQYSKFPPGTISTSSWSVGTSHTQVAYQRLVRGVSVYLCTFWSKTSIFRAPEGGGLFLSRFLGQKQVYSQPQKREVCLPLHYLVKNKCIPGPGVARSVYPFTSGLKEVHSEPRRRDVRVSLFFWLKTSVFRAPRGEVH